MKIVQSFWSKPINAISNSNILDRSKGGWINEKIFYMAWALSCLQLKKNYPELKLELVTDTYGKNQLIDRMGLPYDKVSLVLDDLDSYDETLWAIGKITTYKIQEGPFIHVDGDVFIWGRVFDILLDSELYVQSVDSRTWYYSECGKQVLKYFKNIPNELRTHISSSDIFGVNAGVIGGNNVEFFKHYCGMAINLVKDNIDNIHKIDSSYFNMFYEQFLFSYLQQKKTIELKTLYKELSEDYREIIDMSMIPNKKYNHIVGYAKKNIIINEQVYIRLKLHHPKYFDLIENLYAIG